MAPNTNPSTPSRPLIFDVPDSAFTASSAMKRRIEDSSRILKDNKRHKNSGHSTTIKHKLPGVLNYEHRIRGSKYGKGNEIFGLSLPVQVIEGHRAASSKTPHTPLPDVPESKNGSELDEMLENDEGGCCIEDDGGSMDAGEEKEERSQAAYDLLAEFFPHVDEMVQTIISGGAHASTGVVCCEEGSIRTYRCRDCYFSSPVCAQCIGNQHRSNPFHNIEVWTGTHFRRSSLAEAGFTLHLMHPDAVCPSFDQHAKGKQAQIVHTNGIHSLRVYACACSGKPSDLLQYIHCKILPASVKEPREFFTFDLMKDFHIHSLVSKKSAFDYIRAIRRKTDALVSDIPDPYPQFMRATRLWRLLMIEKRSGRAFGIDEYVKFRPEGSLALPCFPCPYPGFNMAPEWVLDLVNAYIHWKQTNMDGNFHLCKMGKNCNRKDCSIWRGSACLNNRRLIEQHIEKHGADLSEKSTCANFNAVENQNRLKHRGEDITGVFSILCSHGVPEPMGTVDLQRGERYINADFVLANVLRNLHGLSKIIVGYDVACQYHVNARKRFEKTAPDVVDDLDTVLFLVGKMHLQAHEERCQYLFSLNYTEGVGRMDGEETERFWAEMNQAAGSTKQMNTGNREEVLNDLMVDRSWTKNEGAPHALAKRLRQARVHSKTTREFFVELTSGAKKLDPTFVAEWESMSTEPIVNGKDVDSVYRLRETEMPSREEMRLNLIKSASNYKISLKDGNIGNIEDAISFLNEGFDIQAQQRQIQGVWKNLTVLERAGEAFGKKYQQLIDRVDAWRPKQFEWMHTIRHVLEREESPPADVSISPSFTLYLPSDFPSEERKELKLNDLAEMELELRKGQASEVLNELRQQCKVNAMLQLDNEENDRGTRANTRSHKARNEAHRLKQHWILEYKSIRASMVSLGLDKKSYFKDLNESDCYRQRTDKPHVLNTGTKKDGWIWSIGSDSDSKPVGKLDEDDRVHWFRARAARDRCREEVLIAEEDFRRYVRACVKLEQAWERVAVDKRAIEQYGASAYASRNADIYRKLAVRARGLFKIEGGTWSAKESFEVSLIPPSDERNRALNVSGSL
ncbi:hypothetical protein SCHPADRAFT_946616 [Schizopora paradoxa]|uniref:CxC2-like cysteine cluster KDZ transposase-associated domain-containing protein n=1 Tax=Schizopora paradoxa TaxID=27342 RepID=A0A0H2R8E0_9AGAM|nr:hypothetical protein SCHPADRAFT_946812 [Schizopora paradoxa]KLO05793.1 hypothetical protein SCHPADRAFT_946616 [Schizopora paradoxa]